MERLPTHRFTHFGSMRFERREPDGFDATDDLPSSIPTFVSRTNPLLQLSSLAGERARDGPDFSTERRVKLSNFPKDSYWFRSQKDREDSIMETRAETIYDDREDDSDGDEAERRTSEIRVVFARTNEASFS